ncbi:hypothetical protein PFISCL1PPCAC_14398, partial [Pristionchus fissidentatus]
MEYHELLTVIEHVNYSVGLVVNFFLLYCIIFRTKCDLGVYRYRIVAGDGLFALLSTGPLNDRRILCVYLALYTLTFVLNDYSFLYRLWAVK